MNNFLKIKVSRAAQSRFDSTPFYIMRKDEFFWQWWERQHKTIVKLAHERKRWRIFQAIAKRKNLDFYRRKLEKICAECDGEECRFCGLNNPTKEFLLDQYLDKQYYHLMLISKLI